VKNFPKKQPFGALCLICTTGILYLFSKIIPLGMSGDIGKARAYIVLAVILFCVGIPSAVMYQLYRSKPEDDPELERMRLEMAALSQNASQLPGDSNAPGAPDADDDLSKPV
jgi:hypothetical protein